MIQGFKVLLKVYEGETSVAVTGQRDATLNMEMAELETSTKDSEGNKEVEAGEFSWSVDCDRLVSEIAGADTLEEAFFMRKKLTLEIENIATGKGYRGDAIITSLSMEAPYQDAVTSSVSFVGSGALTPYEPELP